MKTQYRAIIVDDEASARNILSSLILKFHPEIEIVEQCLDVEEAVESIRKNKPDLVFLDIEMPNYAGYEITSFFEQVNFDIIFVSAYDQYAIKAFEVSAVDYILKPIDLDRLKQAIQKFILKSANSDTSINYQILMDNLATNTITKIVVPHKGDQKVISVNEIIAIEANESYSIIYTSDSKKYMISKNLKHFESLFDQVNHFFRSHKSWIVNIDYLKRYSKTNLTIMLEQEIIAKLSKYKKHEFESILV